MRTWVVVMVIAGVIGLGGAVALGRGPSAAVPAPSVSDEATAASEAKFTAELAGLGIALEPVDAVTPISRSAAIDIATEHEGERIGREAQAITAAHGRFSPSLASPDDDRAMLPGTDRARDNAPVWIVTFHGVHMLHSGPCVLDAGGNQTSSTRDPYVFGDTNVVLDAETGEVLVGFSYNTP